MTSGIGHRSRSNRYDWSKNKTAPTERVNSKLFSPARIGGVEIRYRIVMPPMTTRLADTEGRAALHGSDVAPAKAESS